MVPGYLAAFVIGNKESFDATLRTHLRFAPCLAPLGASRRCWREDPKHQEVGKNYYVVREPKSTDCRVEAKKVPKDAIMVGKRPYAGEQYAKAALETFRECKPEGTKSVE